MRITALVLALAFFSCTPASPAETNLLYKMPNMDNMVCYQSELNPNVMTCTEGEVIPQDPNYFNTVLEITLSFFPTLEVPAEMKFVILYQPVKKFEKRLYKRLPFFKAMEEGGTNFYVHAHTYFDKEENAIVIECPTPMGIETIVHELMHHVANQVAEDGIIDHLIIDRMANIIIESPRMKEALRQRH
jgi:hypothetical protein